VDLDHGWLMVRTGRSDSAEDAAIYRTADGGQDWTVVASVDVVTLSSHGLTEAGLKRWLSFRTRQDGYLGALEPDGSASVSVTHDGGVSWRRVPLPEPPGGWGVGDTLTLLPPSIADDGQGSLLLVDTTRAARQAGTRTPRRTLRGPVLPAVVVYRTRDGGETWEDPAPAPLGADPSPSTPAFVSGSEGWLTSGRSLWVTSDAGQTWEERTPPPAGRSLLSLAPVSPEVAVGQAAETTAAGSPWTLVITEDAGRTWRALPAPPPPH
jgi:hypothetical protein